MERCGTAVSCSAVFGLWGPSFVDDSISERGLPTAQVHEDGMDIESELRGELLTDCSDLRDYRIVPHTLSSPINSSGVQITGMLNPCDAHTADTLRVI